MADSREDKKNANFRNQLKLLYVFFFLVLIFVAGNACNRSIGILFFPLLLILLAIGLLLNSVPLALLAIVASALFYLGHFCPP